MPLGLTWGCLEALPSEGSGWSWRPHSLPQLGREAPPLHAGPVGPFCPRRPLALGLDTALSQSCFGQLQAGVPEPGQRAWLDLEGEGVWYLQRDQEGAAGAGGSRVSRSLAGQRVTGRAGSWAAAAGWAGQLS